MRTIRLLAPVVLTMFLTSALAGADASTSWLGSRDEIGTSGTAWQIYLISGGELSVPVGDFYSGFKSAGGFGAALRIALSDHVAFRAILRRSNLNESPVVFIAPEREYGAYAELTPDADIWRVYSAVEYYYPLSRPTDQRASEIFLFGGAGLVHNRLDWYGEQIYSGNAPGLIFGSGILLMMSESIGLELGTSFDLVFTGGRERRRPLDGDDEIAGMWDLSAAVAFALPTR